MATDEYHEALLERLQDLQREIARMTQREAHRYAFDVSQEMPEEGARMMVAEMLLDYWARMRPEAACAPKRAVPPHNP